MKSLWNYVISVEDRGGSNGTCDLCATQMVATWFGMNVPIFSIIIWAQYPILGRTRVLGPMGL